jgi:hypothetical protein
MARTVERSLLLPVLLAAAAAAAAQEPPATPEQRFQTLLEEYRNPVRDPPKSDEERRIYIGRTFRRRNELALQFLELAEKNPNDPVALDALIQAVWQVNTTPWPVEVAGPDEASAKALASIGRDHVKSGRLAPLCQRVSYGFREEYETFLRAVLESNEVRDVAGTACLSLAHLLSNRAQRIDTIRSQRERVEEFERLFGRDYVQKLVAQDSERVMSEVEALLSQAAARFADVKLEDGGTVGERAAAALFELRHLRVGREAPEIEGDDQDGRRFKLSDYRGKVVLLDFWSEY